VFGEAKIKVSDGEGKDAIPPSVETERRERLIEIRNWKKRHPFKKKGGKKINQGGEDWESAKHIPYLNSSRLDPFTTGLN